jgi:hypothetical protein
MGLKGEGANKVAVSRTLTKRSFSACACLGCAGSPHPSATNQSFGRDSGSWRGMGLRGIEANRIALARTLTKHSFFDWVCLGCAGSSHPSAANQSFGRDSGLWRRMGLGGKEAKQTALSHTLTKRSFPACACLGCAESSHPSAANQSFGRESGLWRGMGLGGKGAKQTALSRTLTKRSFPACACLGCAGSSHPSAANQSFGRKSGS